MKKILTCGLAILFLCTASACGQEARPTEAPSGAEPAKAAGSAQEAEGQEMQKAEQAGESLEVWTFYDRNIPGYYYMFLWDDIAEEFGIRLDVHNYSSQDMENRLSMAVVTGELPDIFLTGGGSFQEDLAASGICAPVDAYLRGLDLPEGYDVPAEDGARYVVPCMMQDYGLVYYNKNLLRRLGLESPQSWEDLTGLITAVNAYNLENGTSFAAISFGGKDGYQGDLLYDMLSVNEEIAISGEITDGAARVGEEAMREAAGKLVDLKLQNAFLPEYMETGDEEAVTDFIHDQAVILIGHSALLSHLIWNMGEDFEVGLLPGSRTADGKYAILKLGNGMPAGLSINSDCRDRDLAGAVCVEYLRRVNAENVRMGCKSILTEPDEKAGNFLQKRIELNSLIDGAAGTTIAPSRLLSTDHGKAYRTLLKDLIGGKSGVDYFIRSVKEKLANS